MTQLSQFMHFLNQAQLLSLPCFVNSFTWCNNHEADNRIYKRLDIAVVSTSWLTFYPRVSLHNLPINYSHHSPICLNLDTPHMHSHKPFRLGAMWLEHADIINIVHQALTNPTLGTPMHKFNTFTNCFQALAKSCNYSVFGNLFHQKKVLLTQLQCVQRDYSLSQNSTLIHEEWELSRKLHDYCIFFLSHT